MFFPQSHCVVSENLWDSEIQGSAGTLSPDVWTQHLLSSLGSLILNFYIHITFTAEVRGVGMLEEPINYICEVSGKLLTLSVAKFPLCNREDSPYFVRLWVLNEITYIWYLAHSDLLLTCRKFFYLKKKSILIQPNQTGYILFDLQSWKYILWNFLLYINPAIVKI